MKDQYKHATAGVHGDRRLSQAKPLPNHDFNRLMIFEDVESRVSWAEKFEIHNNLQGVNLFDHNKTPCPPFLKSWVQDSPGISAWL